MSENKKNIPETGTYLAYFLDIKPDQHQLASLVDFPELIPDGTIIKDDGNIVTTQVTKIDGYEMVAPGEFKPTILPCQDRVHSVMEPLQIVYRCMCRGCPVFNKNVDSKTCNGCEFRNG